MWIPGCHRLQCSSFLRTQNEREDLALREAKHLLGGAYRWREGLRGQRCGGMGKRQQDGSHSLIRPGLHGIYKEKKSHLRPKVTLSLCMHSLQSNEQGHREFKSSLRAVGGIQQI